MVDACKKANVKLLVGYRMHFEPKTLEVVRMRMDGELGKILFFRGLSGFRIGDPTPMAPQQTTGRRWFDDGHWYLFY